MIVLLQEDGGLGLRRVRWWDRLIARTRSSVLDRELAAGASPESSLALAVHAGRLCEPAQRSLLARSLTRVIAVSDAPAGRRLKAPVCRPSVRRARGELSAVVGRLTATAPVGVQGVARIRALLADGTGPLYQPAQPDQLRDRLVDALAALDSFG